MKSLLTRTAVLKFGGSSVGSPEAFKHVGGILVASRDAGNRTVGVLSAMYGVTNRLLESANLATKGSAGRPQVAKLRAALLDAHVSAARKLCKPAGAEEASAYIADTMKRYYDDVIDEIAGKGEADAYDTDCISSVGERWSTKLMSAYLCDTGVSAPFFESDRIIMTDGESGNARPILDATRAKTDALLQPLLDANAIPLVTGFFGSSLKDGKLTTLGRGGSDLSAAVLGYCLDATEVSLYKVEYTTRPDGWMDSWAQGWVGVVHDADPTSTIEHLSYEEARELAHFAKKVLHPETVSPAVEKAIPIAVRNTYDPLHPGTVIQCKHKSKPSNSIPAAINGQAKAHQIGSLNGSGPSSSFIGAGKALDGHAPLVTLNVNGSSPAHSIHRPVEARVQTITKVPLKAYEAKNTPLSDLDLSALNVRREEAALVVLVGLQVMAIRDIEERVTSVLRSASIPVYVPRRVNGSENNFSVIVPETRRNEAVDILHKAFVLQRTWQSEGIGAGAGSAHGAPSLRVTAASVGAGSGSGPLAPRSMSAAH